MAVHIGRLWSILLGVVTLAGVWVTASQLAPGSAPWLPLAITATAAFVPQFVYGSAIINNDALAAAFPGVLACPETLPAGPIALPEGHPLIDQTVHDCLTELMDVDGLIEVLSAIRSGVISA